jgi:hypothetical protein
MRLAVAEVVVFHTTSAVINVTNTVVANIVRRAAVELPIAVERQRISGLEQVVREQHNHIVMLEQQVAALTAEHRVVMLEQQVAMLTAEQQRVISLEQAVADLQQQLAPGKQGRPNKPVTDFNNFMTDMVMQMMTHSDSASSSPKSINPVEQYAQYIAAQVAKQQSSK